MKATLKASYTGSTTYTNYLSQAMSAAGMQYTMTYTEAATSYVTIDSTYSAGSYKAGIQFYCKAGTWSYTNDLNTNALSTTAETMSTIGTIKYAPYGTGRRVAVPVS